MSFTYKFVPFLLAHEIVLLRNLAPVHGGERELRVANTTYLRPFKCTFIHSLTIMTSYASYDGVPTIAKLRILVDIPRKNGVTSTLSLRMPARSTFLSCCTGRGPTVHVQNTPS